MRVRKQRQKIGLSTTIVALIAIGDPQPVHADEPLAAAERLFQESRALVEKGRYAEACPQLEASMKLEPAIGTQFNLADCWEHTGKNASAQAMFMQVARIARAAGKFERDKSAKARAAALESKVARVRLVMTATAPGLELFLDGVVIDRAGRGDLFPLDSGPHRLRASAPNRVPWEGALTALEGQTVDLEVPELAAIQSRPAPYPTPHVAVAAQGSTQSTFALVAGVVGASGLVVGGVSGVLALSARATAREACPAEVYAFRCPTEDGTAAWNNATRAGNISTVAFLVGGVFSAGAALLWLTSPKAETRVAASLTGFHLERHF